MDKKISDLTATASIDAADVSVLVHNNTDYRFTFATLLTFLGSNLATGSAISFGTTLPQNTAGRNGDVFVNTTAASFAQKISGTWTVVYTLPSLNGLTDGTVLYGLGTPASGTGNNNDTYINTGTGIFYKKTAGTWSQVFTMLNGPAGVKGDKGDKGDAGPTGRTILSGTGTPSNLSDGVNGDYYINTATLTLFGPKTSGIWGSGTTLVGAQGEKGDTGDTGAMGPAGATGPKGDKGDKGDTGDPGATGATGATGPIGPAGEKGDKGDKGDTGTAGATGPTGAPGAGVPTGGTTGQVLSKIDNTDYHAQWSDALGGGGSAAGSGGQIQFNDGSGGFGASDKLTWDNVNGKFYINLGSYAFKLGGPHPVILFENNDDAHIFGTIGNGPALSFDATDADFVVAANTGDLWLKGNTIHLNGAVTFPASGSFGQRDSGTYIGYGANTSLFQFYGVWGSGAHTFAISNTGGALVDPLTNDDMVLQSTGNIHIGRSNAHQYSMYAQFNMANKSLILDDNFTFNANSCSLLQLDSTTRGFLPPRMTSSEKSAISTPIKGLIVYDSTVNKLCVYTGSAWETIASS